MAYNNTPLANQRISDTQPLIQKNFQQIQTAISVNHVPIADGSGNQGKHNLVQFVQQAAAPATGATELALYTKAVSGLPQLFMRLINSGNEYNISGSNRATLSTVATVSQAGYFYVTGGLLIKFGQIANVVNGGPTDYPLPTQDASGTAIPAFTTIIAGAFAVPSNVGVVNSQISCSGPGVGANARTHIRLSNNGSNTTSVFFIAIGY